MATKQPVNRIQIVMSRNAGKRVLHNQLSELGIRNSRAQISLIRDLAGIRQENNVTVDEVAEALNIPVQRVHDLEKGGTNPTMNTLKAYAHAIGAELQLSARVASEDN